MPKLTALFFLLVSVTVSAQDIMDPKLLQAMKTYRSGQVKQAGQVFHQIAHQGKHKDLATIGLRIVRGDYGVSEFTLAHCLLQEAALHGGLREKRILVDFYLYKVNPFNNPEQALVWKKFLANKGDREVIKEFKEAKQELKDKLEKIEKQSRELEKSIVRHLNNKPDLEFCQPAG